jgi:peptidylprolyl isomerase
MTDRRRRQKEQRAAKLEAEKKQKARRELFRRLSIAVGFGLLIVLIFAVGSLFSSDEQTLPEGYTAFREQPTACGAEAPPEETPMTFAEADQQEDLASVTGALIETSCGDVHIELDPTNFPITVNSFVFLAREGFYDGQVFHRILANFVVQGGDPDGNGQGGPGYSIEDEFPSDDFSYVDGTVAMANAGAGTTGSQFFIVIGDDAAVLNPRYNILGAVTDGHDALDAMAEVPVGTKPGTNEQSVPLETVYIERITIETSE